MSLRVAVTAVTCLWAAVATMAAGTHFTSVAPQFEDYLAHVTTQFSVAHAGEDLGPGAGLGIALVHWWPFFGAMLAVVAAVLTGGLFVARAFSESRRLAAPILPIFYAVGCVYGALGSVLDAVEIVQWRFFVAAVGSLLFAAALLLLAAAAVLPRFVADE